jgi:hypothetical protein
MTTETLLDLIAFRCREAIALGPSNGPAELTHGLTDVLGLLAEYAADQEQQLGHGGEDDDEGIAF